MSLTAEGIVKLLRVQNHDFLNQLQVVAGYLQLERSQEALFYLRETANTLQSQGLVLRWHYPTTVLLIMQIQLQLSETGIKLQIESQTDLRGIAITEDNLNELIRVLFSLWENGYKPEGESDQESLLFRVLEHSGYYSFEFSFTPFEKQREKEFKQLQDQVEEMGCRLEWTPEAIGSRMICTIPKKTSWLVAE